MIRKSITIILLLILWWIAALFINRTVILPLPLDVFYRMFELATSSNFYISILYTLFRITLSFSLAMMIGITLGILSGISQKLEDYLSPILSLLQSIPHIAFILIILVWFRSFTALIIIVLLMLLPAFYHNALTGIKQIDRNLIDVIHLYHQPLSYTFFKVYIPLIKGYILSAIDTCLPLGFKVGVMAEIFVQTQEGIGTALYFARTQIDMISIFAWTLWMVIIILLLLQFITYIKKKWQ